MSTAEKALIDCLTKNNYGDSKGPSFAFQQHDHTTEELLNIRTPALKELFTEIAKSYSTPGGYLLDATCGAG